MYDKISITDKDGKYTLNLVHILHCFSIIVNSSSIDKDVISLDDLKKAIDKNKKLFDEILDVERILEMVTKAYAQILEYSKKCTVDTMGLLELFKTQLENQIKTLKNYYVIV